MSTPHRFKRKDVREAAGWLYELGFEYVGQSGGGHPRFSHPQAGFQDMPWSASRDWHDAFRAEVARKLGITKLELEVRLGLRQEKRSGAPRRAKRKRNERGVEHRRIWGGRSPREGDDPKSWTQADVVQAIAAVTHRLNQLDPGGDDYQAALDELHRLRAEYLEKEEAA